jgi:maleate isomerase
MEKRMRDARETHHRIGMVVPSSNTTMEAELPELLRRQQMSGPHRFSVHAARLRLQQVTPEALQAMNHAADGAVDMLSDAQVDAIAYACLVAVMIGGRHGVAQAQARIGERAAAAGRGPTAVVTSAGALIGALKSLEATRVSVITPYRKELTERVAATIGEHGIEVVQSHSLEVVDNAQVGRLDQRNLLALAAQMDLSGSDALVLSACVQMPSLAVVEEAEQRFGLPVISAATATAFELLNRLDIEPQITHAGSLLRRSDRLTPRRVA